MATERHNIELREWRRQWQEKEERERMEKERPAKEAEEHLKTTLHALGSETRKMILNLPDPEFVLPQSMSGVSMPYDKAREYNAAQLQDFIANEPEFYDCKENRAAIFEYLLRQNVAIADAATYQVAFRRLRDFGLLSERPGPEPEAQPVQEEPVIDPEQIKAEKWQRYTSDVVAVDPRDGKGYTAYMLDRVDSETYRRLMFGEHGVPKLSNVITRQQP